MAEFNVAAQALGMEWLTTQEPEDQDDESEDAELLDGAQAQRDRKRPAIPPWLGIGVGCR